MAKTAQKKGRAERRSAGLRAADYKFSRDIPYFNMVISCACGATYAAGSIMEEIRIDICAKCHPFFTGESRILDAEGRVDKFRKRYNLAAK